jgi:hypothetical protein
MHLRDRGLARLTQHCCVYFGAAQNGFGRREPRGPINGCAENKA